MKNIEKYNESKAALNAYNSIISKKVPFDVWLVSIHAPARGATFSCV